jgi:hypothetical protein
MEAIIALATLLVMVVLSPPARIAKSRFSKKTTGR